MKVYYVRTASSIDFRNVTVTGEPMNFVIHLFSTAWLILECNQAKLLPGYIVMPLITG